MSQYVPSRSIEFKVSLKEKPRSGGRTPLRVPQYIAAGIHLDRPDEHHTRHHQLDWCCCAEPYYYESHSPVVKRTLSPPVAFTGTVSRAARKKFASSVQENPQSCAPRYSHYCGFQGRESNPMANILLLGTDVNRLANDELILAERGHRVLVHTGCGPAPNEFLAQANMVINDVSTMNHERWLQLKRICGYRKCSGDSLLVLCKSSVLHSPTLVLMIERLGARYVYAR